MPKNASLQFLYVGQNLKQYFHFSGTYLSKLTEKSLLLNTDNFIRYFFLKKTLKMVTIYFLEIKIL